MPLFFLDEAEELLITMHSCEGVIEKSSKQYFKNIFELAERKPFLKLSVCSFLVKISTPSSFKDDRTSIIL